MTASSSSTSPAPPKPRTFCGDLEKLPAALLPFTRLPRWVVWRWELRASKNGRAKWTKPPFQPSSPERAAKSNDSSTWGIYDEAVSAVLAGKADGIGLMLKDGEAAAGDLDHVRNAETGESLDWAGVSAPKPMSSGSIARSPCRAVVSASLDRHRGASCIANSLSIARAVPASSSIAIAPATSPFRDCRKALARRWRQSMTYLEILLARYDGQAPSSISLDFNDAGPQEPLEELIESGLPEGERSEKFQSVVWRLARQGRTAEEIAEELAKYPNGIGAKYAGRLPAEVKRSFGKWQRTQQASATGATGGTSTMSTAARSAPWPQIYVKAGEIPRVVAEAEKALISSAATSRNMKSISAAA